MILCNNRHLCSYSFVIRADLFYVKQCCILETSPRSLGWNTGRSGFSEPGCHKKYLSEGKDPIPAYPQITKADWAEFKRVRATKEFVEKSFKQSELQKKNIHPHRMGVAGYYGMKLIWD